MGSDRKRVPRERILLISRLSSANYNDILGKAKDSQAHIPIYYHIIVITIIKIITSIYYKVVGLVYILLLYQQGYG